MADYFPEGIIINILERLPVKTLIRCTCICKSWYSLITSPQFISSHLNSRKKFTPLLLLKRFIRNSECYTLHLDNELFHMTDTLDFSFSSKNSYLTIIGSCNGLLCLSDDRIYYMHTIILWNPCIKKFVVLPKPNLIYNSYGTFIQSIGFGFDRVSGDYKVVRITYVGGPPQVEVYKLSNGIWQDISCLGVEYFIYNKSRNAYVYGATHWIARFMDCYDLIVLFDMCHEVFQEMRLPDNIVGNNPMESKDLVVCMESLALVICNVSRVEPRFCIWVMKEYGDVDSWSKHFNIDFSSFGGGSTRPLWVRKNGEVIAVSEDGRLICYDLDGEEIRDLGVRGVGCEDYQRSLHVDGFVESLVLLERGRNFSDVITCNRLPTLQVRECDETCSYASDYEQCPESDYEQCSESDYKRCQGSYVVNSIISKMFRL